MTIDEAISHAREVAESQKMSARLIEDNAYIPESVDKEAITYGNTICANEHEQLAEWLEELKQYRTIGTPEELKAAMKYVYLAKKHGTVGQVIENCVKYEEIGTPEECRAAMERQNPIAAIAEKEDTGTTKYTCPTCGMYMGWSTGSFPARYCWKCGQKLDWEDKE